ncbi:MAG: 6-carboxytetrahydropterin synthase QueD [Lachnospira sp.]|nr:6-carboxytetrahydropterin synthase QueD [Lachnospira sp.]
MYYITTEASFDAAHFLKGYEGKCKNIHGHRWRVLVKIQSDELLKNQQHNGMIVDFKELKNDLKELTEKFDHTFIFEKDSLKNELIELLKNENFELREVEFRPTAENFSKYFYDNLTNKGYQVAETMVYETPNNMASYCEK